MFTIIIKIISPAKQPAGLARLAKQETANCWLIGVLQCRCIVHEQCLITKRNLAKQCAMIHVNHTRHACWHDWLASRVKPLAKIHIRYDIVKNCHLKLLLLRVWGFCNCSTHFELQANKHFLHCKISHHIWHFQFLYRHSKPTDMKHGHTSFSLINWSSQNCAISRCCH